MPTRTSSVAAVPTLGITGLLNRAKPGAGCMWRLLALFQVSRPTISSLGALSKLWAPIAFATQRGPTRAGPSSHWTPDLSLAFSWISTTYWLASCFPLLWFSLKPTFGKVERLYWVSCLNLDGNAISAAPMPLSQLRQAQTGWSSNKDWGNGKGDAGKALRKYQGKGVSAQILVTQEIKGLFCSWAENVWVIHSVPPVAKTLTSISSRVFKKPRQHLLQALQARCLCRTQLLHSAFRKAAAASAKWRSMAVFQYSYLWTLNLNLF